MNYSNRKINIVGDVDKEPYVSGNYVAKNTIADCLKIWIYLIHLKMYCQEMEVSFDDFCCVAFGMDWKKSPLSSLPDLWNKRHPHYEKVDNNDKFVDSMISFINEYRINQDFI